MCARMWFVVRTLLPTVKHARESPSKISLCLVHGKVSGDDVRVAFPLDRLLSASGESRRRVCFLLLLTVGILALRV